MNRVRVRCVLAALTITILMAGSTAFADAKGEEVLKAAFKKLEAAKTLTFDLAVELQTPVGMVNWKGKVAAMKPNYLRVELEGSRAQSFFADGMDYYMLRNGRAQKLPLEAKPVELPGAWEGEIDAFFGGEKLVDKVKATYGGAEKLGDLECDVVKAEYTDPVPRTATYAIGKSDRVIHRAVIEVPGQPRQTNRLTNLKFDVAKTAADFKYTGPAAQADPVEAALLPIGNDAPDFNLPTATGGRIGLADARKGKKATLVNFWFYN